MPTIVTRSCSGSRYAAELFDCGAILRDRETGNSRGFAFVEMATEAGAQNAIKVLNGDRGVE